MIDKQKLLQWISDKEFVNFVSSLDDPMEQARCNGAMHILAMLEMSIRAGNFDTNEHS